MKKSYGYVSRNRGTNDATQGEASSSRYSINAGTSAVTADKPMDTDGNDSALSIDSIDRQLMRFFKEQK